MIKTIQSKIVFSFCFLIVIMLIGQITFNLFFSKEYFLQQNKNDLQSLYSKIVSSYSDEKGVLYDLTSKDDSVNGFAINVFSSDELIYSSRNNLQFSQTNSLSNHFKLDENIFKENPVAKVVNYDLLKINDKFHENIKPEPTEHLLTINGKIYYNNDLRYISISKPLASIESSVEMFTKSSIIIALIILFVGTIIVFIIAKTISKPILEIEKVSNSVAKLDFSVKANENVSTLEISNLAKSINSMSNQLNSSLTQLRQDIDYQLNLDKNRKQFIANVSHEMKTPLALLQIYSEILKDNIDSIDKDEYCNIIVEETLRLDSIVKDMLNVSSIENDISKTNKEIFNLSQSCSFVVNSVYPLMESFNIKIDIEEDIFVLGDKKQLDEAIRNYINNARSHTNGFIEISLKKYDNNAVFSVYNSGKAIKQEDINKIWESFYKSDKARSRKQSVNAGLGLYIVKTIIEKHNGSYLVENCNNGVKFSFKIKSVDK